MSEDLDPLDPATAKEMHLEARTHELAQSTLQPHNYRLKQFVRWCDSVGLESLNDITGRYIPQPRVKRRTEDELSITAIKGQLATLRVFLRFCASIDAVESGLDEKIILPKPTGDLARTRMLAPKRAELVLDYLGKYHYARLEHVLLEVLWHTGLRIGAAVSLDVEDYDSDEQLFQLVHRPESGTPLKNGIGNERFVALSSRMCDLLDD